MNSTKGGLSVTLPDVDHYTYGTVEDGGESLNVLANNQPTLPLNHFYHEDDGSYDAIMFTCELYVVLEGTNTINAPNAGSGLSGYSGYNLSIDGDTGNSLAITAKERGINVGGGDLTISSENTTATPPERQLLLGVGQRHHNPHVGRRGRRNDRYCGHQASGWQRADFKGE